MGKIAFYTNESVNVAISEGLKRRGIKIFAARDAGNLGLSDEEQLNYAAKNNFVIVTHDDDFLTMAIKYDHKGYCICPSTKIRRRRFDKEIKIALGCCRTRRF